MTARHTPGPWELRNNGDATASAIGAGGLVICRFPRLVDEIAAEQVANMTAVLAVPALIEALEEASIALALAWQITKRDDLRATHGKVVAAINSARGQA